jgi:hypothetical protein
MEVVLRHYENRPPVGVASFEELRSHLAKAGEEASEVGRPHVVFIEMPSGNSISMIVGAGTETVLGFQYGHGGPPYFSSKRPARFMLGEQGQAILMKHGFGAGDPTR